MMFVAGTAWNNKGLGSIQGGGLIITGADRQHESLQLYFSSGMRVGIATLRRDGFASVGSPARSSPPLSSGEAEAEEGEAHLGARLLTVPLIFHTNKSLLFLNLRGGLSRLELLPGEPSTAQASTPAGPMPLLSMAAPAGFPSATDSTMLEVKLQPGSVQTLAELRGKRFRLSMDLEAGARLYAFWLSEGIAGQSGGWLGAGGAAYPGGLRDV